ncbi:MAG: deacylase [Cytophagaceae bacterium]|nr:deacylase [Cytophagaceae bacterium]
MGLLWVNHNAVAQTDNTYFILPELQLGKTMPANQFFPETNLQKSFFLSIANDNTNRDQEWLSRLNRPWTGLSIGFTDFGNTRALGTAISLMPFAEFDLFPSKTRLKLHLGLGASRFTTKFNQVSNRFNRGISTDYSWSFRSFLIYDIFARNPGSLRLGAGFFHQSNGHTKLPNQGLNSFLLSFSSKITPYPDRPPIPKTAYSPLQKSRQYYLGLRIGIGQHVLTYDDFLLEDIEDYNQPKEVYAVALSSGIVINRFLKVGAGVHYRFYEHYYDYIVKTKTQPYARAPTRNASNIGIFFGGELLLSHVGLEFQMGINFYKPFYEEEWLLNEEQLNWYYQLKKHIPTRMGLKLYALNTNNNPKHNVFIGAHINANLGQADFTELTIGYVRRLSFKNY